MKDSQLPDMFIKDKTWLAEQPEMIPWDGGCQRLLDRMSRWVGDYSQTVCKGEVADDHTHHPVYVARLWKCLAHHWRQALEDTSKDSVSSDQVAQRVGSGHGYRGGGQLGGNPLRDVVLAVAMVQGDERAPVVFETDYRNLCRAIAHKLNARLTKNPDDEWWNDLLYFLAGYTGRQAKLDSFHGKSALPNWLPTPVYRFLSRWMKREWKLTTFEEIHDEPKPTPLDERPLIALVALIRESIAGLAEDERQLFEWHFLLGKRKNAIARMVGVHPANIGRQLDKAIEKAAEQAIRLAPNYPDIALYEGVLEEITKDTKALAAALRYALGDIKEEDVS